MLDSLFGLYGEGARKESRAPICSPLGFDYKRILVFLPRAPNEPGVIQLREVSARLDLNGVIPTPNRRRGG